jgi:hypothetical protein
MKINYKFGNFCQMSFQLFEKLKTINLIANDFLILEISASKVVGTFQFLVTKPMT